MYPIIFRFASELRWGEAWRWSKGQIRQNSIFGYFSSVAALLILMKIDSKQVFKVVHKFIFFLSGLLQGLCLVEVQRSNPAKFYSRLLRNHFNDSNETWPLAASKLLFLQM